MENSPTMEGFFLRNVHTQDLPVFFAHQQDPIARHMAAFTSPDPTDHADFEAHWKQVLSDPLGTARTIISDGGVAGHILTYDEGEGPEITYWLGREFWGTGLATRVLLHFLAHIHGADSLRARVASDNAASLRVLIKCGFVVVGTDTSYAPARGIEIVEFVLERGGAAKVGISSPENTIMADTPAQQFIIALHALEESSDPEPLAALYTESAVVENLLAVDKFHGPDGARQFWIEYRGTFAQAHSKFRNVIETAERASLEWTTTGTGAHGNDISYSGVTILEIEEGGRIARSCAYFNPTALGRQVEPAV